MKSLSEEVAKLEERLDERQQELDSYAHDEQVTQRELEGAEERVEDLKLLIADFLRGVRTEDELLAEVNR